MQDASSIGFNGYVPMPIRHGLTLGELARLFNGEKSIGADLTVVPMKNWRRDDWFDATGLAWANPSPNMRNMVAATVYPGIGAIEGTNISVGQGHRHAVRAARGAVDRRPCAGGRAQRARICPAFASIRSRSRRRPARSSAARRVTASSSSSPTAIGCGRSASASRSRRRCPAPRRSSSSWRMPRTCSGRRRRSRRSAPASIPPRLPRRGRQTKRSGASHARSICCTERLDSLVRLSRSTSRAPT